MKHRLPFSPATQHPADEFDAILRQWGLWFRLRRAAHWGVSGLIFALAFWIGVALAAVYYQMVTRIEFLQLGAVIVLGILLAAVLVALLLPVPRLPLARFFDHTFNLRERMSTALEIRIASSKIHPTPSPAVASQRTLSRWERGKDFSPPPSGEGLGVRESNLDILLLQQRQDALRFSRQVRPGPRFFWRLTLLQLILLAVLAAANVAIPVVAKNQFDLVGKKRQVQQEIAQEIKNIEELQAQIASNPEISPEKRAEIQQALEEARQGLENAQTEEQAIAVLTSTEQGLKSLEGSQAAEQAQALQQAGNQLQQSAEPGQSNPLEDFASDLAQGDNLAAASDLQNIDPSELTPEEAAALAGQLDAAAASLQETNPELAQELSQAAEALRQGDAQAARQALDQAGDQLAQTGQQIIDAQAAGQAAEGVGQGQQRLLQAAGQSAQTAQGNQPGQGSQPGSSTQPGQGQGSGSGKGESSGQEGQGSEVGDTPIASDNGPGDSGEKPYDQIFAPQRLGPGEGETVTLPPSNLPGEQVTGSGDTAPGQEGPSSVPYISVYTDYAQAYWQALESGSVPPSMRELVRKYFSSLNPTLP